MSCAAGHESHVHRHHVLCFECYRSERERLRAQVLSEIPAAPPIRHPGPSRLTQREITHREQMLRHLVASNIRPSG